MCYKVEMSRIGNIVSAKIVLRNIVRRNDVCFTIWVRIQIGKREAINTVALAPIYI